MHPQALILTNNLTCISCKNVMHFCTTYIGVFMLWYSQNNILLNSANGFSKLWLFYWYWFFNLAFWHVKICVLNLIAVSQSNLSMHLMQYGYFPQCSEYRIQETALTFPMPFFFFALHWNDGNIIQSFSTFHRHISPGSFESE